MMKPSVLQHSRQNHNHKNKMIIRIHRTHMICEYDKSRQRLMTFGKMQRPNNTKEPAGDICPLEKFNAIYTNKSFLLQDKSKANSVMIKMMTHLPLHYQDKEVYLFKSRSTFRCLMVDKRNLFSKANWTAVIMTPFSSIKGMLNFN